MNYPSLTSRHIYDARLFATRYDMVRELAADLPSNPSVCEVGVALGDFSENLMRSLNPSRFVAVDWFRVHEDELVWGRPADEVFKGKTHGQFYRDRFAGKPVEIHEGDSAPTLSALEDETFDLIYLDGDHSYESVKADAQAALRKIKPSGILIFNDYIMIDTFRRDDYGVVPVVNQICADTDWRIIGLALEHSMFCDVALKRC
jgi:hypothetical protein